jgi:phage-related protein
MARKDNPPITELHFEGDSLEVLTAFPDDIRKSLGFSLWQLQNGLEPACGKRSLSSVGRGVYELKESDERTWYRAVYLSKIDNAIYVLHCFEKDSRKSSQRDLELARKRLSMVNQRIQEQRTHEKHAEQSKPRG